MSEINEIFDIDKIKLKKILSSFKNKQIAIIGDVMMDEYYWGKVSRISPEAPVPVVKYMATSHVLGGASNVANNIIALGGKPLLIGVVGKDDYGQKFTSLVKERGLNSNGIIVDSKRSTTVKTRIIAHQQQMLRIDREDTEIVDVSIRKKIIEKIKKNIKKIDGVVISDYAKGIVSTELLSELIPLLKKNNIFIAVDPQIKHFREYKNVSILTPNNFEASQGIGIEIKDENTLIKSAEKIMQELKSDSLLITQGENGMTLFEKNNKYTHIPTVAKHVYDVTGAGDTVISAFILAVSAGATLLEAAYISNHAAGIVVGEVGTSTTTVEQLSKACGINT